MLRPSDFADVIVSTIQKVLLGPKVDGRFVQIEARIATLEAAQQKGVTWAGVHQKGATYEDGELVTNRGLWLCTQKTDRAPAEAPACWRLVCKERGTYDE